MAVILENRSLGEEMYLLRAQYEGKAEPGQFFMLRSAGSFPLLSRPLSIFDVQDDSITFLYKVIGEGTKEFSRLSQGMELELGLPMGSFEKGKEANFVLVDLHKIIEINPNEMISRGKNTPFAGRRVLGQVKLTMKRGEIYYDHR